MALIMIVDDDRHVRESLVNLLESVGHATDRFDSAEALLERDPLPEGDCAVLDVRMKGLTGLDLQTALRARGWRTPIIFLTAHCDDETRGKAMAGGAYAFFCKPFDDEALLACIDKAVTAPQGAPAV